MENVTSQYRYNDANTTHAHSYLWEPLQRILAEHSSAPDRIFDVGCGNGSMANSLQTLGWKVSGVDPSEEGIKFANQRHPDLDLHVGNAYEDLGEKFGTYPFVLSLEVVEHVYYPRDYAKQVFNLLEPGGSAIISTPYHGYIKNVALAVSEKLDNHFTALWDGGHIKFWSPETLTELLAEAGLTVTEVHRVGRIPPLAKSMILVAKRPA